MAVAFFVRIRGIFLVSDAPLHQHQHMFDEHFLLNTVIIKNDLIIIIFNFDSNKL